MKTIETIEEWEEYKRELESNIKGIKYCMHEGEPEEFPFCIRSIYRQKTINQEGERYTKAYYQHIFFYQHHAEKLLNLCS